MSKPWPASGIKTRFAFAGIAWFAYEQIDQLADRLPSYRENVRRILAAIRTAGPLKKMQERLADLVRLAALQNVRASSTAATVQE